MIFIDKYRNAYKVPLPHSYISQSLNLRPCMKRLAPFLVAPLVSAMILTSCANSATSNGDQACILVRHAVSLLKLSPPQTQSALLALRNALPLAAIAAGTNGGWQPLEATLSETNRVSVIVLVPALSSECSLSAQGNPSAPGIFQQANIK